MRKVHLVSISEPVVLDLALALKEKGYDVSASGTNVSDYDIQRLREVGIACPGEGWFPDRLTKDIQFVVLGSTVRQDNPEFEKAKVMGLLTISIPEFIFQRTKGKTRLVVSGSKGKKSIISMIIYAFKRQHMSFDYALSSNTPLLPNRVGLSYAARIAIIEGDEHVTSALEARFQLEFYRPHIAVISNIDWIQSEEHATLEGYISTYRNFTASIEREGKLIYYGNDRIVSELAAQVREDITAIPYDTHEVKEENGQTVLTTRYGNFPVKIQDEYFLTNLNAARLACRHLGMKDADFYKAISEYSLTMNI
ncbi:Mur ligase family protein [Parabacteroides pacaensis]|uniref:Mur ligase family protein n=1 Tax=Parabacteroides pacaensis TaxID=2086575 RepID=UPI000D0EF8A3|nr:Mur ligase family protein [Parabacteroides pacaensis]